MFNNFYKPSRIIHSSQYEKNKHKLKNKRILIVGGGETSHDIAIDLVNHTNHTIYVSIKNGQWFLGKILEANEAADLNYNRLSEFFRYKSTLRIYNFFQTEIWGYGGSGIKEWEPKLFYFDSYFTKGREIMTWISKGMIEPCSGITSIHGNKISFGNKEAEFDYIILSTGYKTSYLSNLLLNVNHDQFNYKHIFNTDDNTLSYCGFIRPVIGSIPMISELQAILISLVYSNKIKLINRNDQIKDIKCLYKNNIDRLKNIVSTYEYSDELATLIGNKPSFFNLFFTNHPLFWRTLIYPWTQYHYTITSKDKNLRQIAKEQINIINNSKGGRRLFRYTLMILFTIVYIIINRKYDLFIIALIIMYLQIK